MRPVHVLRSPHWKASARRAPPVVPLTDAQRELVGGYRRLARRVLSRHFGEFYAHPVLWEHLESAAAFGLCLAARRYDPARHAVAFQTFAYTTVWGTCKNAARNFGRALELGGAPGGDRHVGAAVPDWHRTDPADLAAARELTALAAAALRRLDPTDARVLRLHYGLELTTTEIAAELGVSRARVCQRLGRAVDRFRARNGELAGEFA